MPMGSTAYEHRRIATRVPVWDVDKCVECTECSLVCPHAAIRPFILSAEEAAKAPEGFPMKDAVGSPALAGYKFHIQNYPEDCLGCSSCSIICPGHALTMTPLHDVLDHEIPMLDWAEGECHAERQSPSGRHCQRLAVPSALPGAFRAHATAGCGETPYVKLLAQLFGERMLIANATGCSSISGCRNSPPTPIAPLPAERARPGAARSSRTTVSMATACFLPSSSAAHAWPTRSGSEIDDPQTLASLKEPL